MIVYEYRFYDQDIELVTLDDVFHRDNDKTQAYIEDIDDSGGDILVSLHNIDSDYLMYHDYYYVLRYSEEQDLERVRQVFIDSFNKKKLETQSRFETEIELIDYYINLLK